MDGGDAPGAPETGSGARPADAAPARAAAADPARAARPLVILRLGADHRCAGWATAPRGTRGWDLLLAPYQPVPDLARFEADHLLPRQGGKWDAVHDLLAERPELLRGRRLVWIPDDDIEADASTVERFLEIATAEDLRLCQPALTRDSEFFHFVTVQNRFTRLRHTNFVELMAPCLHVDVLRAALPLMKGRRAAKGLDFMWHRLVPAPAARRVAVIDATPVRHARPKGRHLAAAAKAAGGDVEAERRAFFEEHLGGRWHWSAATGLPGPLGRGWPGRAAATATQAATLATTPRLWRVRRWKSLAMHFWGQLRGPRW